MNLGGFNLNFKETNKWLLSIRKSQVGQNGILRRKSEIMIKKSFLEKSENHLWGNTAKGNWPPDGENHDRTDTSLPSILSALLIFLFLTWQWTFLISSPFQLFIIFVKE